jgi:putative NIF3 family GTP cyclohydrolase 1 type 2
MEEKICRKSFDDLDQIVKAIMDVPEYEYYARKGNPPIIVNGSGSGRPGKIAASEFTGGTNGPEELVAFQGQAGVGTILTMHATEKSLEEAKKHHVNVIQCSHMASDVIGMNLLLDEFVKMDPKLRFVEISGMYRYHRKGKEAFKI